MCNFGLSGRGHSPLNQLQFQTQIAARLRPFLLRERGECAVVWGNGIVTGRQSLPGMRCIEN